MACYFPSNAFQQINRCLATADCRKIVHNFLWHYAFCSLFTYGNTMHLLAFLLLFVWLFLLQFGCFSDTSNDKEMHFFSSFYTTVWYSLLAYWSALQSIFLRLSIRFGGKFTTAMWFGCLFARICVFSSICSNFLLNHLSISCEFKTSYILHPNQIEGNWEQ